jgi:hypothetical protein
LLEIYSWTTVCYINVFFPSVCMFS